MINDLHNVESQVTHQKTAERARNHDKTIAKSLEPQKRMIATKYQ